MPKDSNRGFNPLDILATAAALQIEDKPTEKSERDMTQQTELSVTGKRNGNPDRKESGSKPKVEIRKIKVVTVCSDLEKMFDEHNYGNSRKISIKPSDSCSADDKASTKERKVIVTVVDKSGDHRVVKTFNSAKLLDGKGVETPSSGSGDSSSENSVTKLGESIKISCGEKSVNNSALVQTVAEGDNSGSVIPQVNKDSPDQVRLFTSITTQVNNDKNSPQDTNEHSCTGEELINATSNCQEQTDSSQNKVTCDIYSEQGKEKVDILTSEASAQVLTTETDGRMGQKLKVNRDVSLRNIQTKDSVTYSEERADLEKNTIDDNAEFRGDAIQIDQQGRNSVENLVSNHPPEITSSKARAEVQLSQSEQPVTNTANVSDGKSISTSKGENSVYDSTLSDNGQINIYNSEKGEESSDMISGKKEAGENSPKTQLYDEDSASETCEHRNNDSNLMSPLGKYSNPMDCGSCLDELEDTQNWHYEGEPGRSDVRLSIDLDSPKSEKPEIKYDEINKANVEDLKSHDNVESSHLSSFSDDNISAVSDRKCYFDDHCYADFSSQRRTEQNSQSFTEDDTPYGSSSDLSQDSGISDISPSPNTKEIHVDVCGLSDTGIKPSLTIGGKPVLLADSSLLPLLQMKCNKEGLAGLSEINRTRDAIIALVQSNDGNVLQTIKHKPQLSPVASVSPPKKDMSPKFGKYRIGTFASVSNSAMGLESPKKQGVTKGHKTATSLLANLTFMNTQGKSRDAGHGTERKSGNQTSPHNQGRKPSYRNHIEHDHDYCLVQEYEAIAHRGGKDGTSKRAKEKKLDGHDRKSKKIVPSDLDKTDLDDSLDTFPFDDSSQPASPSVNHSHGTRQKLKSSEKIADYVKSGCSDSKLKITGSFQDDFIYFLNTKSRSRRRTLSQDIPMPVPADRILLPLPKPGDIVVPHLTDADLEAIKQGHPSAAKPMQRYPVTSSAQTTPVVPKTEGTSAITHAKPHSEVSDEENKIINTILSMETGEPLSSQSSVDTPSFLDQAMLPTGTGDGLLSDINLTPEQMEIIYHAMDEVQSLSPDVSTADTKFDVDADLSKNIIKGGTEDTASEDGVPDDSKITPTPSSTLSETKVADSEESTVNSTLPVSKSSLPTSNSSLSSDESNTQEVIEPSTLDIGPTSVETSQSNTSTSTSFSGPGVVNTMPDISFTPLDKSSLDIFGNDLKLFPEASVDPTCPTLTSETNNGYTGGASANFTNSDNSAPWIVTVSMYWNDLPAIMIDKLPYVRLVDIHKQILPAKDTGILKKRCQLLSIPVLNCTEMQRYFLVQYGKAFNSKSTLIIGKDNAKMLIGYYVNPASVSLRVKEHKPATERLHEVSKDPVSSPAKPKWSPLLKQKLETPHSSVEPLSDSKTVQNEVDSPKQTTKTEVNVTPSTETTVPTRVVKKSHIAPITSSVVSTEPTKLSSRTRHKKINFLEMLKGDSNNNTAGNDVTVVEGPCEQNSKNDKTAKSRVKDRKNSPESRSKTQETADIRSRSEKQKHRSSLDESIQVEMNTCDSESENNNIVAGKRKARWESNTENSQMMKSLPKDRKRTTPLKVKWAMFSKKNTKRPSNTDIKTDSKEILAVVHKDMTPKNGQRGRIQAGNVFIDLYDGPNVPCVRCCTCKKLFSVDNFLKHLHEIGGSGKLLIVTQPQTFALRDSHPSESQKKLWGSFQKRRRLYNVETRAKNNVTAEVKKSVVVDEGLVTKIQSSLMKNRNVRISSRKRKPKQLHPIENYSFAKSSVTNPRCNEPDETDENFAAVDDVPSPAKIARILPNLTANIQSVSKNAEESSDVNMTESVVTLTNGPEVISFTALENGFDV